jgi:hypothetical protein
MDSLFFVLSRHVVRTTLILIYSFTTWIEIKIKVAKCYLLLFVKMFKILKHKIYIICIKNVQFSVLCIYNVYVFSSLFFFCSPSCSLAIDQGWHSPSRFGRLSLSHLVLSGQEINWLSPSSEYEIKIKPNIPTGSRTPLHMQSLDSDILSQHCSKQSRC